MSRYAKIAAKLVKTFASDLFTDATITRAVSTYDPRTLGAAKAPVTIPCRAVLGTRKGWASNGVMVSATVVTTNKEVKTGDKLTLRGVTYVIDQVSIEAPDGVPLAWEATVKA